MNGRVHRLWRRSPAAGVVAASFYIESGGLHAWVRKGVRLEVLAPPDGDPDRLFSMPSCGLVKDQRKVRVGVVTLAMDNEGEAAAPALVSVYVKRYNVFSWRVKLASLVQSSPAFRAWGASTMLAAAGFRTPTPLAAIEYRRWGMLEKSFLLTVRVEGGVPADQYWWRLRRASAADRRAFIAKLGQLFAALHAAGVYHSDLKDANVLVRSGGAQRLECYLLDLERVRQSRTVPMGRRVKNLVQLHRTLGRLASMRENLYFLRVYLGDTGHALRHRRRWRRAVCAAARRKDLQHLLRGAS